MVNFIILEILNGNGHREEDYVVRNISEVAFLRLGNSPTEVSTRHQLHTEILGYGGYVQQWFTDDHKTFIGHHRQQNDLSYHT